MMNRNELPAIGAPLKGGFYAGMLLVHGTPTALVVAPKAQGDFADRTWHDGHTTVAGSDSFFDGRSNTLAMAEAGSKLAKTIVQLDIGGFTDWHLPSRDELELLYRNLKPTADANYVYHSGDNPSSLPAGYPYTKASPVQASAAAFREPELEAFEPEWYWSSTQHSEGGAWSQYFDDGLQDYDSSFEARARAVRWIQLTA